MGIIKENLQFQGQWRSYQKKVLDHAQSYGQDHKIHIVAAPGSGKTTLGIELIRRLDAPCLVLAPSITIRDQWLARIREGFLPAQPSAQGNERNEARSGIADTLLSNNIRKPAPITAITYQALHSCIRRENPKALQESEAGAPEKGEEQNNGTVDITTEQADYSDFNFFQTIADCGIRTICLDEAHHLRSEWWKALEEMVQKLQQVTIISLTATPPYDSTPAQWQRYISLCGPIDEEISVPELVKENSLCAHQDYVYFNMPTAEEAKEISTLRSKALECAGRLLADDTFAAYVAGHKGLAEPDKYADTLLDNPDYFSAQLIFLQAKKIAFSPKLLRLLGTKGRLPDINLKWMELLLQGFLYADTESYACGKEYREQLITLLKSYSLIHRNKVTLSENEAMNKLLLTSKGKLQSIVRITGAEYLSMGRDLRLLVLTDYIKKEHLASIGNQEKQVNELGVVPIFETLRREKMKHMEKAADGSSRICELQLAALSGTVVILPQQAKAELEGRLALRGLKGSFMACGDTGYYRFTLSGSEETAASLVTELFQDGYIQVLIGTKSLLGEGWDSPCINALILASFVGSFMLSNQMRGRAIRTMKGSPEKVSNIWHLICMLPESTGGPQKEEEISQDFQTLQRRFKGFLGVHYEEDIIENGMERLSMIQPPYNSANLERINENMLTMASRRDVLRQRWKTALSRAGNMEVEEEVGVAKERLQKGAAFYNALAWIILGALLSGLLGILFLRITGALNSILCLVMLLPLLIVLLRHGRRLFALLAPKRQLKAIGKGVLSSLYELEQVQTKRLRSVVLERKKGIPGITTYSVALAGGTEREKTVFADAVNELFGMVDNQRYLLRAKKKTEGISEYYCVPEVFGRRKEDAALFAASLCRYLGSYELVYTRNEEGRKVLLEARVRAFANRPAHCAERKKRIRAR